MIRVLVVDDSALMRKVISNILSSDSGIEVVGIANNGRIAIDKIKSLNPDVVTMDIEMPEMDGLEALEVITKECPVPVIIVSAHSKESSKRTIQAMEAGAVDFVLKPSGEISLDMEKIKEKIISTVKSAAKAKIQKIDTLKKAKRYSFSHSRKKIIVIASSTGGPQTLEALLTELPKNIPVPILIVQHMPPIFTKSLADRLNNICEIEVREAKEGDELENGVALIAPGGYHMELKSEIEGFEGNISLNKEPPELGVRPNANKLFMSVAGIFKENTIGVVLTGMGMDGKEGSRVIKEYGGTIIAEAKDSCIIYGMPKEVIEAGLADEIVQLKDMAVALVQLADV